MEARETQPGGRGAVRRKNGCGLRLADVERDELTSREGVHEVALAAEVVVEAAREVIVGDEDMRLAAQAPAEGRVLSTTGAGQ